MSPVPPATAQPNPLAINLLLPGRSYQMKPSIRPPLLGAVGGPQQSGGPFPLSPGTSGGPPPGVQVPKGPHLSPCRSARQKKPRNGAGRRYLGAPPETGLCTAGPLWGPALQVLKQQTLSKPWSCLPLRRAGRQRPERPNPSGSSGGP